MGPGPPLDLDRIAATVLVLVLVLVQLRVVTAQVYVLWKGSGVLGAWCRAGEIPYAPRPFGLAHGGNRRNGSTPFPFSPPPSPER